MKYSYLLAALPAIVAATETESRELEWGGYYDVRYTFNLSCTSNNWCTYLTLVTFSIRYSTATVEREASPVPTEVTAEREASPATEAPASPAKEDTTMTGALPTMTGAPLSQKMTGAPLSQKMTGALPPGAHPSLIGTLGTGKPSLSGKTMITTTVAREANLAPTDTVAKEASLDPTDTVAKEASLGDTTAVDARAIVAREASPVHTDMVAREASLDPMDMALASPARALASPARDTTEVGSLMNPTPTSSRTTLNMSTNTILLASLQASPARDRGEDMALANPARGRTDMALANPARDRTDMALASPARDRGEDMTALESLVRVDTVNSVELLRLKEKSSVTSHGLPHGVDGPWMMMMMTGMVTTTVAREESLAHTDTVEREASLEDITAVAAHVSLMNLMSTSTRPTTPTHISQNQMMITRLLRASLARDHTDTVRASLESLEDMDQASLVSLDHTEDMDQASLARDHTHQVMATDGLVMVTSTTNQFVKNLLH